MLQRSPVIDQVNQHQTVHDEISCDVIIIAIQCRLWELFTVVIKS